MKKSFWGYNVQEVDELIDELEAAKAKASKQIKSLNEELEKVMKDLVEERTKALSGNDAQKQKELETKNQEATKEISSLRKEVSRLRQTNDMMSAQIATYNEERLKSGVEQASIICRDAYEDMANAKDGAKASIDNFLENFWKAYDQYEQKIQGLYEDILHENIRSKESFLNAADEILQKYMAIVETDTDMKQRIDSFSSMRLEAQTEIQSLLNGLVASDRTGGTGGDLPTVEEVEEKYQHSILREIANNHKLIAQRQEEAQKAEEASHPIPMPQEATVVPMETLSDKGYSVNITSSLDKRNVMYPSI